ncbi:MAG: hypothetical protein UW07_C0012G0001, partial [Candidatus Nomurabacteria bacterium GW2011_GWF2_43_8]
PNILDFEICFLAYFDLLNTGKLSYTLTILDYSRLGNRSQLSDFTA